MAKQKKRLKIIAIVAGLFVAIPRPAQAFSLPGPLNSFVDMVFSRLGLSIGEKLNGYLELGLGKLDALLGIDPGTLSGKLGIIDPLEAAQSIDGKSAFDGSLSDMDINPVADGHIKKGLFNTGLGLAIGSSILSKDGQSALKDTNDATDKVVEGSGELAQKAQKSNVTQDIAKIQTQQNAQEIGVLNVVSEKQDLQLQQQAGINLSSATTAEHSNAEEARVQEESVSNSNYTTQQSGMADGVIGEIGK
jgi:hypothetical protein